jgi:hypothetical protein
MVRELHKCHSRVSDDDLEGFGTRMAGQQRIDVRANGSPELGEQILRYERGGGIAQVYEGHDICVSLCYGSSKHSMDSDRTVKDRTRGNYGASILN